MIWYRYGTVCFEKRYFNCTATSSKAASQHICPDGQCPASPFHISIVLEATLNTCLKYLLKTLFSLAIPFKEGDSCFPPQRQYCMLGHIMRNSVILTNRDDFSQCTDRGGQERHVVCVTYKYLLILLKKTPPIKHPTCVSLSLSISSLIYK